MLRPFITAALGGLIFVSEGLEAQEASCPAPPNDADAGTAMTHVRYLADDALEGRSVATSGERCAAEYIAERFRFLGLEPAGPDGSFFQPFEVRVGSRLGAGNALAISGVTVDTGDGWLPFGFAASAEVSGALLLDRDLPALAPDADPAEADDLRGRIVVLDTRSNPVPDPHYRAATLARRGAEAVVVVMDDTAELPDPAAERRPAVPVPALAAHGEAARAILEGAGGGATATLRTDLEPLERTARNVVALLPGSASDAPVVVGAHYDHLGRGGAGSLAPDSDEIHNGADDNASGTAALIEAAEILATGPRPRHPVLFLAFSGEERGLLGSAWYVENPTVPIDDAVAMINMDMVGRLRENALTVYGMVTAEEWEGLVTRVNDTRPDPFDLALLPDGFGPSDHSSFYGKGIPVLHLFTNTHTEYHRPEDDAETLNGEGIDRIASYAAQLTSELAGGPERVATTLTANAGVGQPTAAGDGEPGRGYGPYFGSIPDMSPIDYGVRLSGVREDSPAERAGVRTGDVLVGFGGHEVSDLYAFTYALREREPGERVEVVVERDGERITLFAVLGERR